MNPTHLESLPVVVDAVKREVAKSLKGQDGIYQLLLSLIEGQPLAAALLGAAWNLSALNKLCQVLLELRSDCRVEIIPTEALEALIKSVTGVESKLPVRKTKKLRLCSLQIRVARKLKARTDQSTWNSKQLHPALITMFRERSPNAALATNYLAGIDAQIRDSPALAVALTAAAVTQRR